MSLKSDRKFKVYPRYKTITSQNVPSEAQIKNFFNFQEKLCSVFSIFKFLYLNHPMIDQICDVMTSTSTRENVGF